MTSVASTPRYSSHKLFLFVAPLFVALLFVTAQTSSAQVGSMNFAYTHNVYALDDTSSLVELSYQYSERGLVYERVDGRKVGRLLIEFRVWDSTGRLLLQSGFITTNAEPKADDEDHALLGVKLFGVRPGSHKAQLIFEDVANAKQRDSVTFSLPVRSFKGSGIALSDVQVISEITPSDDASNKFFKTGYIIYPNVLSTIEPPFLLLNTYVEVYRANTSPTSQFDMVYALSDSSGRLIYTKVEKRDRPTAAAIVDVHSIVVDDLPTGSYSLFVKAFAGQRGTAHDSSMVVRWFTLFNPEKDAALAEAGANASPSGADLPIDPLYAGLNEAELDELFTMYKYLTIPRDIDIWNSLSGAEAKGRFMTSFWMQRDTDPGTARNELRDDYLARIDVANSMYKEPLTDAGYKSDRGRIMLKYGKPDGVERHYFDKNRKPFEVWRYSKDNVEFVFVDRSGMGKYVLVHSNASGEIRQENWEVMFATVHENFDR